MTGTVDGPTEPEDEGGDPACWVNRVCFECGRFAANPDAETCADCGADLPASS